MRSTSAWIAGFFAGLLGVALWASLGELFGLDVVFGGVLVGLFVGAGVAFFRDTAAKSDLAFAGGLLSLLMISGGTVLNGYLDTRYGEEFVLGNLAEGVLESYETEGHTLQWREESDASAKYTIDGYPSELWMKAREMWQEASPEQRMEYRAEIEQRHGLTIKQVARSSFDTNALVFLGAGALIAALLGAIFGGHVHEAVIVTAYQDAAETENPETHPYLAPGSEYGMNEEEQARADAGVEASNAARRGWDEAPETPEEGAPSDDDGASNSFAGFASAEAEETPEPGFGEDGGFEGEQKKAG
ncbi:MAG: hypothetical protein ACF8GE_01670 [Phycisphaerales bacterium JB043]